MPTPIKIQNTVDVIEFEINGKVYTVPLATGMKREELEKLNTETALMDFFAEHLGADLWNGLTVGAQNQIARAWADENQKVSGVSVGESQASPVS